MTMSGVRVRRSFAWKLAVAAMLVGLGDLLFFQWGLAGGNVGWFLLAMIAGMIAARSAVRRDRRALVAAGAAAVFGWAMVLDPSLLAWALFWLLAGMAALLPATGRFDDGWRWFQRLVLHGLRTPLGPILDAIRIRKAGRRKPGRHFSLPTIVPVLAVPVIGSAVIVWLFAAANPVLEQWLSDLALPEISGETVGRILLWTLLFIASWSLVRPRLARRIFGTFNGSGDLHLPGVSVTSVKLSLIAFNLLFAVQNMMDAAYLGGVIPMPDGITLAEYAHRSAYPLIVTAILAALFVVVTLRPGSSTAAVPAIRRLVVLWIAQNVVLVGSSVVRTVDYIEAYSLTVLRISALAWMLLVATGLVLTCWRLLAEKSAGWLINANLVAAGLLLSCASFVDLGNLAAWWNIRHAREVGGRGAQLDLCYLNSLGSSSLLPLIELEQNRDLAPWLRERVQAVRTDVQNRLRYDMIQSWTLRGARRLEQAEQLVAALHEAPLKPALRNCDGTTYAPAVEVQPAPVLPQPPNAPAAKPASADKSPDALTAGTGR